MSLSLKLYFSLLCAITIQGYIIGVQNNLNVQNSSDSQDNDRDLIRQFMSESINEAMNHPDRIVNLGLFHSSSKYQDQIAANDITRYITSIPGYRSFDFRITFTPTNTQGIKKIVLIAKRKLNA